MIDLHCHILPGLDDGPEDEAGSLALARCAHAHGIRTIVATPHVREDYPFQLDAISLSAARVRTRLDEAAVSVDVLEGAEVAVTRLPELDTSALETLRIGDGGYILIESPYLPVGDGVLERALFDLQARGFSPVLAHPERSPVFLHEPDRLKELVRRGVLCSATAGSIAGRFGGAVRRFTLTLFREGLIHNVASDAHDAHRRPPSLSGGLAVLEGEFPDANAAIRWFTVEAPSDILAGRDVGDPPRARPRRRLRVVRRADRS